MIAGAFIKVFDDRPNWSTKSARRSSSFSSGDEGMRSSSADPVGCSGHLTDQCRVLVEAYDRPGGPAGQVADRVTERDDIVLFYCVLERSISVYKSRDDVGVIKRAASPSHGSARPQDDGRPISPVAKTRVPAR